MRNHIQKEQRNLKKPILQWGKNIHDTTARGTSISVITRKEPSSGELKYYATIKVFKYQEFLEELQDARMSTDIFWKIGNSPVDVAKSYSLTYWDENVDRISIQKIDLLNETSPGRVKVLVISPIPTAFVDHLMQILPPLSGWLGLTASEAVPLIRKFLKPGYHFKELSLRLRMKKKFCCIHGLRCLSNIEICIEFFSERDKLFFLRQLKYAEKLIKFKFIDEVLSDGNSYENDTRLRFSFTKTNDTKLHKLLDVFVPVKLESGRKLDYVFIGSSFSESSRLLLFWLNALKLSKDFENLTLENISYGVFRDYVKHYQHILSHKHKLSIKFLRIRVILVFTKMWMYMSS